MRSALLPYHRILILGASGKVGCEARKALFLLAPDCKVVCTSRKPWDGPRLPNETWLTFDPFHDAWNGLGHVQVVVNCIGAIQPERGAGFEDIHVGLVELLLENREMLGMPRIVHLSALGARPDHFTDFLATKGRADALLMQQPNCVILRPSIVCTPGTMLSQKLRQLIRLGRFSFGKLLVPTGFPFTQVQPVLGADLGRAIAVAAMRCQVPHMVEVVGPQRIAFGELIEEMAAVAGKQIRLIEVSRDIMETFVRHLVSVWFPELINYDQFRLLFEDNVGELAQTTALLGRPPLETLGFWRQEMRAGADTAEEGAHPIPRLGENPIMSDAEKWEHPTIADVG